ncbi:porin [Scytonema hofmannii PCC 7110]|uniref:Porin n=1 Tax=Scytonema hofmannii PCC 7110 TaxID=128403 RepID=A0A139WXQ5_9CYAN|nr:iron uptake porin [Scytonema hofmannii]KYC37225.1 porin [Scytonema hofmannii PCC 7110]
MIKIATTCRRLLNPPANFWVSLLISSAVVNSVSLQALANEINQVQEPLVIPSTTTLEANVVQRSTEVPMSSEVLPVANLLNEENVNTHDPMSQVTNTSQLQDISPGDWAYEALLSLIDRYGCIQKYPDGTYRGNRAISRYEFAAGLNACLQQIEKLIAVSSTEFVSKEDLATLQRLTDEFKTELTTLDKRVDRLEEQVTLLDRQQFSTTTKLSGLAWFNLTGASAGGNVKAETTDLSGINNDLALRRPGRENGKPAVRIVRNNPSITFSNLVWLTLDTSFTGKDSLITQLAVGNGNSPANVFASAGLYDTFGTPFFDQSSGVQTGVNQVVLRELAYRFPVGNNIQLVVGLRINWNRYFDDNAFTFILTGASSFNSDGIPILSTIDRGAGAVLIWNINKKFQLHLSYLGESDEYLPGGLFNSASNPQQGLFNGTNVISSELTFSPSENINLRFIYNRSNIQQINGFIGGPIGEPIYGFADDGFGGPLRNATADIFGFNFDWRVTPGFGVFGRYAYGSTHLTPVDSTKPKGDVNAQSFQLGVAFPDLGKQGALATISYLIPFSVLDGRKFLVSGGGDGGVQYEFEMTYFYPLTNNIAIVPAFYLIGNVNNFSDNPNIYVGNIRVQFSF